MHYIRKIEQDRNDVRSNSYYVYKCSICGEESWLKGVPNFDASRLRKCPNCGVEDDTNNKEYLIKRKHDLEQGIKRLSEECAKMTSEYDIVSAKLEVILSTTEKHKETACKN